MWKSKVLDGWWVDGLIKNEWKKQINFNENVSNEDTLLTLLPVQITTNTGWYYIVLELNKAENVLFEKGEWFYEK